MNEIAAAERPFGYEIMRAQSFDEVLRRTGVPVDLEELLDLSLRRGRVLVQGAGGSGKSYTVRRLLELARTRQLPVALVNVADTPLDGVVRGGHEFLLSNAAGRPDLIYETGPFLLIIDGLNEVDRALSSAVLLTADHVPALYPASGVLVTDRLVRRPIDPLRWVLVTLSDIPRSNVTELLGRNVSDAEAALYSSPVYLEQVLRVGGGSATRSGSHAHYLETQLGLTPPQIEELAEQALDDYLTRASRVFSRFGLSERVGEQLVDRLVEAGALQVVSPEDPQEGSIRWRHHLLHDYLASRAASKRAAAWDARMFDALTFQAASHDALVMLLEQSDADARDALVRLVYDWNVYGAAYMLAADEHGVPVISEATRTEILALLGERQFDRFVATGQQARDALLIHGGEVPDEFLACGSVDQSIEAARTGLPNNRAYEEWLQVFAYDEGVDDHLLRYLSHEDGVYGWTATNVVRRLGIESPQIRSLEEMMHVASPVVRWRIVHIFGIAGFEVRDSLFRSLKEDQDARVRFGSLRSLVEQALLDPDRRARDDIFQRIADSVEVLRREPRLLNEFERVLQVHEPPDGWAASSSVVIEKLLANSESPEELERWRMLSANVRLGWTG